MSFWRKVLAIMRKDVISEMRSKEIVFSVLVFALLSVVVFNFAFSADTETMNLIAPGVLWVTFAFSGVLSLNRAFIIEREAGCMEALLSSPVSRETIYIGKVLGSLVFMLLVEIIILPAFSLLFNINVFSWELITITLFATIGFVAVGTLFAAMAVNTKAREMVLPILFLPIISPVIIAAVKASGQALAGEGWGEILTWLEIIIAFDIVFTTASYLVFSFVIEE